MEIKSKEIKIVDIDSITPNPKNNNMHNEHQLKQLEKIIKVQGFRSPLTVSNRSGFLVAGHLRLDVAKKLGFKELPVIYQDFENEAMEYAHLTADNAIAAQAEINLSQVNQDFLDFGPDFDVELLGLKDFVIEPLEKLEPQCDEDEVPEVVHPITRRGDIWLLGNHRVMCGDATNITDMEKLVPQRNINLWLTDPPYNVAYTGKTKDSLTIQNDEMGDEDFRKFLYDCYVTADSVMRAGASFYIWHADLEGYNFRGAAHDMGWRIRQCLIWKKQTLVMGRQDYHWRHEPCLYGWKEGAAHLWASDRKQTTILEFDRPSRSSEHPTMKPVDLFEYQLKNNTKIGDAVLDSFCGSGTTIIASEKSNRVGYGMELDEKYCDVIINRWQNFTGKKATLESSGQAYDELKELRNPPNGIKENE